MIDSELFDADVAFLLDGGFAGFDYLHAGHGIVQSGKWLFTKPDYSFYEMLACCPDGIGIGGIGLRMDYGGSVFHPVSVAVASGTLCADHLDHEGPGSPAWSSAAKLAQRWERAPFFIFKVAMAMFS